MRYNTSDPLPSLPSISKMKATRPCACGCGFTTTRRFAPGHDARAKGWIIRIVRGVCGFDAMSEGEADGIQALMADEATMKAWRLLEEVTAWVEAQAETEAETEVA